MYTSVHQTLLFGLFFKEMTSLLRFVRPSPSIRCTLHQRGSVTVERVAGSSGYGEDLSSIALMLVCCELRVCTMYMLACWSKLLTNEQLEMCGSGVQSSILMRWQFWGFVFGCACSVSFWHGVGGCLGIIRGGSRSQDTKCFLCMCAEILKVGRRATS